MVAAGEDSQMIEGEGHKFNVFSMQHSRYPHILITFLVLMPCFKQMFGKFFSDDDY